MALRATDVARDVDRVVEAQIGLRHGHGSDAVTVRRAVPKMAKRALAQRLSRVGFDARQIAVIAAVAGVAASPFGQHGLCRVMAGARLLVASGAGEPELLDVPRMVEAN